MAFVPMSSIWGGRRQATVIVIVYFAGLAFYYGAIKPMNIPQQPPVQSATTLPTTPESNLDARVPSALEVTGRGRKK